MKSKFTEPYRRHTRRTIKGSYFDNPGIWAQIPACERLAKLIRDEERGKTSFPYLDVPQLVWHILGLSHTFGAARFELLYLWYYVPSIDADQHRNELTRLKEYLSDEIYFREMTYQELFENIKNLPNLDTDYISYLN